MKFAKLTALMVFFLLVGSVLASPMRAQSAKAQETTLETPFVLSQEETARIVPEGIDLILRSVGGDSGCLAADDCSVMLFNGTIAVRQDGKVQMMQINASIRESDPLSFRFGDYTVLMTAIKKAANGRFEAAFQVARSQEEKPYE
jgi:hypothetical protein